MTDPQHGLLNELRDDKHPKGSPILGRILSATACRLGHNVVVMELDTWDEPWFACSVCGARFLPEDALSDDTEVVAI